MDSHSTDVLAGKQVELKALDFKPLRCAASTSAWMTRARRCRLSIEKRIPPNYSSISARIGDSAGASGVRLVARAIHAGQARLRPDRDFHGCRHQRRISADHALCQQPGARPDLLRHSRHGAHRPARRAGESAAAVSTWLRPADADASGLPSTPEAGEQAACRTFHRQGGRIAMALLSERKTRARSTWSSCCSPSSLGSAAGRSTRRLPAPRRRTAPCANPGQPFRGGQWRRSSARTEGAKAHQRRHRSHAAL